MNSQQASKQVATETAQAPGPLFVVSMWRSGSSLLYALLNKHPQVGLMYEGDLLLLRSVFLKPAVLRNWSRRWQFWNHAFTRHGMDSADWNAPANFPEAFEAVHKEFARRKGAAIWGDKSPNYYDRLRDMAETFPAARFIIIWRDPLATANSIVRAGEAGNSYFRRKGSLLRGLIGYRVLKEQCEWLHAHGKSVLEISYEDLVNFTEAVMQQVCSFLEIEYRDEITTLAGSDRTAIYAGRHHALIKGNEIVSDPRPNVVDAAWRAKVDRYAKQWRNRYVGSWPPFHRFDGLQVQACGRLERFIDTFCYRALRAYDSFVASCFSIAPLALLSRYRERKFGKAVTVSELTAQTKTAGGEVRP